MSKSKARFTPGADAFHYWRDCVHTGSADPTYPAGDGAFAEFPIAPKRVTLLGGAPGQGKTALSMQLTIDALRLNPALRACVCNVEMGVEALLDRQLARISGVDLTTINGRQFTAEHSARIDAGMTAIEQVADRLCFVSAPFDLGNVAEVVDETDSEVLILDYIQRIKPPSRPGSRDANRRADVDATMDYLRQFAEEGLAVFVVAAVARTKDKKGRSSYDSDGLGLASFRESSELEFGADDAFLLVPDKDDEGVVVLRHLKARHGEPRDMDLEFDRPLQRFTAPQCAKTKPAAASKADKAEVSKKLRDAWTKKGAK